ncbi:MAG: CRISPR-associated protein Cas4 [Desulfurococcales archaeon]|nr:CRISPR-associated protein Cas4 [Desulfurococcales archaeon]
MEDPGDRRRSRMLYSFNSTLTVSMVKQYSYCKAIPWIMEYYGLTERPTPSMKGGVVDADFKLKVAEELGLPRPWRVEVRVYNKELALSGVVDIIAGNRPYTVVEVKSFRRRVKWSGHFKDQLMVYALLVTKTLGAVREAILYMGGSAYRFKVTQEDLQRAERLIESTKRILESEEPPLPRQPSRKCSYCWYKRVCPSHP